MIGKIPSFRPFLLSIICLLALLSSKQNLRAQELNLGNISGSFQTDAQWYFEDKLISAQTVDENIRSNSFLQLVYQRGDFSAGIRYEAYLNPLLGFRGEYQGQGVPYRFANYRTDKLELTVGNFYDQFGSGMIFRAYQEWTLGIDNSVDGVRVKLSLLPGFYVKALTGRQRKFWDKSAGLLRGTDAEWFLHESFPKLAVNKWQISLGTSFMSRFLEDDDVNLILPENVSTYGARFSVGKGKFNFNGEYAYKINDPINKNLFSYNSGNGIFFNASYNTKGLGIIATAKRVDNLDFRSERNPLVEELTINFLPPTTLQHLYRLSTLYPYATQPQGEFGAQLDIIYKIPKKTAIGGKYGTQITFNYSRIHGLNKTYTDSIFKYDVEFSPDMDNRYFEDINLEVSRKWSKKLKTTFSYINLFYNKGVIELGDQDNNQDSVRINIAVLEFTYKLKNKQTLRGELQGMFTNAKLDEDQGDWVMALLEYSIRPNWFFSVFDEYNYGNPDPNKRPHYFNVNSAYRFGANRVALGFGRQRAGLLCVGGICRVVPASTGLTFSMTSTF